MDACIWCIHMPGMGSVHRAAYNLWRCFDNAVVVWHTSCRLLPEVIRVCNAVRNTSMHIQQQQQQQQRIATHVAWLRRRLQKLRDVS
jgi:hypothetical protein